ncbi:hypothetical protein [Pseudomonas putida]|uniref:hypothetical protein n=1 Tax=Pseudomonas putida TaxID=303 RepID=UPI0009BDBBA9
MLHTQGFAVALAAWQEQRDADTGLGLDVLDAQACQFITAKTAPEPQQQQRAVTTCPAQGGQVVVFTGLAGFFFKTRHGGLQMLQQQRGSLFGGCRVQGADAAQHLTHQRRLGWVGEALGDVPLAERGQALAQGADRMLVGVVNQVAGDALGGGREKTAPVAFEVLDGGLVAAPGVVTGGGAKVALDIGHGAGVDG